MMMILVRAGSWLLLRSLERGTVIPIRLWTEEYQSTLDLPEEYAYLLPSSSDQG
jgi:hypothetical protein